MRTGVMPEKRELSVKETDPEKNCCKLPPDHRIGSILLKKYLGLN
jgi:hypothetical protein